LDFVTEIARYLPKDFWECIDVLPDFDEISEIRFSLDKPALVSYGAKIRVIKKNGSPAVTDKGFFSFVISKLTGGSMYSVNDTMRLGYVTIDGGHRVGICGSAVTDADTIKHIKDISSLCFRFCRQIRGCSGKLFPEIASIDRINNILIASPPGCGKTTLLRDICRVIADGKTPMGIKRVGIADERGEIAAMCLGRPRFDLGVAAFVCDSYPKAYAMNLMLRSMSPDVLATDEIGTKEDFDAVRQCLKSGVSVIATAHGSDMEDILYRFGNEIKSFDIVAFLKGKGEVSRIYRREKGDY